MESKDSRLKIFIYISNNIKSYHTFSKNLETKIHEHNDENDYDYYLKSIQVYQTCLKFKEFKMKKIKSVPEGFKMDVIEENEYLKSVSEYKKYLTFKTLVEFEDKERKCICMIKENEVLEMLKKGYDVLFYLNNSAKVNQLVKRFHPKYNIIFLNENYDEKRFKFYDTSKERIDKIFNLQINMNKSPKRDVKKNIKFEESNGSSISGEDDYDPQKVVKDVVMPVLLKSLRKLIIQKSENPGKQIDNPLLFIANELKRENY